MYAIVLCCIVSYCIGATIDSSVYNKGSIRSNARGCFGGLVMFVFFSLSLSLSLTHTHTNLSPSLSLSLSLSLSILVMTFTTIISHYSPKNEENHRRDPLAGFGNHDETTPQSAKPKLLGRSWTQTPNRRHCSHTSMLTLEVPTFSNHPVIHSWSTIRAGPLPTRTTIGMTLPTTTTLQSISATTTMLEVVERRDPPLIPHNTRRNQSADVSSLQSKNDKGKTGHDKKRTIDYDC